jgi:hypothetical protein
LTGNRGTANLGISSSCSTSGTTWRWPAAACARANRVIRTTGATTSGNDRGSEDAVLAVSAPLSTITSGPTCTDLNSQDTIRSIKIWLQEASCTTTTAAVCNIVTATTATTARYN